MAESMPPIPEEMRQLYRGLTEKILDKACSDPTWKQQLLDNTEAALRAANFPETQRLEEMRQKEEALREAEVVGHLPTDPMRLTTYENYCCTFYTLAQTRLV
jgi:hypothetical protein